MENEFENKNENSKDTVESSSGADNRNCDYGTDSHIPYGNDYNQVNQSQPDSWSDQYHSGSQGDSCGLGSSYQNGSYAQNNQNGPTYQAPDYGFRQDRSYHQQGGFQNDEPNGSNQGFHNEYQENQNGGYYSGSGNNNDNKKKSGGTAKKVLIIAGCAVVIGVLAGAGFKGIDMLVEQSQKNTVLIEDQQDSDDSQSNSEGKDDIDSSENSGSVSNSTIGRTSVGENTGSTIVSDIAEEAMASMVSIDCTITETYSDYFGRDYSQDETGSGSGFILGESDTELFIATNNHVVEGANSITITFIDDTTAEATTKGTDSTADLAVISVQKSDLKKDTMKQIKIASMGDSNDVRLGEMVVAIGNALGYGQSVTVGYISAKDREVEVTEGEKMVLLQTDAAINPGNSGGALINLDGRVIGIPSVKYADSTIEGMGFAIPISRATPILDELMKREVLKEEEKGYLGVSCLDVTSDANTMYGIPIGVYVSEISNDGAAKEAGIQVGDIITAINGVEITSKEALVEKVHSYRIGTEIILTIQRSSNGKYKEIEVKAKLKEASTIDGLSGTDGYKSDDSANNNNGSSGNSGNSGNNGGSGSSDGSGNNDRNYYGKNGTDDFYDFFNEFFN